MKKKILGILIVLTMLVVASPAKAATMDDLMAQVKTLGQQVSSLSSQLSALTLGSISSAPLTKSVVIPLISTDTTKTPTTTSITPAPTVFAPFTSTTSVVAPVPTSGPKIATVVYSGGSTIAIDCFSNGKKVDPCVKGSACAVEHIDKDGTGYVIDTGIMVTTNNNGVIGLGCDNGKGIVYPTPKPQGQATPQSLKNTNISKSDTTGSSSSSSIIGNSSAGTCSAIANADVKKLEAKGLVTKNSSGDTIYFAPGIKATKGNNAHSFYMTSPDHQETFMDCGCPAGGCTGGDKCTATLDNDKAQCHGACTGQFCTSCMMAFKTVVVKDSSKIAQ